MLAMNQPPNSAANAKLPWTEKYRPKHYSQIMGQPHLIQMIDRLSSSQVALPHLLLFGPPGTGKTTTAHCLARALLPAGDTLQQGVNFLELNASDERGINVVRTKIKQFAMCKSTAGQTTKVIVLDEADALTADAQTALRRVIEQFSKSCRFFLLCNQVSRVIEPLTSRCAKIRFGRVPDECIRGRLVSIAGEEGLDLDPVAVDMILQSANGDCRAAINMLQSASLFADGGKRITSHTIESIGNLPNQLKDIYTQCTVGQKPIASIIESVNTVITRQSYSPGMCLEPLVNMTVDDQSMEESRKARLLIHAGVVDGRMGMGNGSGELMHLLSYLGELSRV